VQALDNFYDRLPTLLPALATTAVVTLGLWLAHWLLLRRRTDLGSEGKTPRQIVMLLLTIVGIICVLIALPMHDATRSQLMSLIGVALTAVIALSSTTFIANAMAGLMLRAVKSFRPGDFIRVGEQFGRVTERGLFHTEIQTEDRDLTTLPNLHLVSNPITVVRASGTIVSARLSLGYDVSHDVVRPLLVEAAGAAELSEPFAQVVELGDFSVTYRVAGFLAEAKQLLSARSKLRMKVLDTLHEAGIEIVSPTFMNQRVLQRGEAVVPEDAASGRYRSVADDKQAPEEIIFDKAESAEKIEQLRNERVELLAEIKSLEAELGSVAARDRGRLDRTLEQKRGRVGALEAELSAAEARVAQAE